MGEGNWEKKSIERRDKSDEGRGKGKKEISDGGATSFLNASGSGSFSAIAPPVQSASS